MDIMEDIITNLFNKSKSRERWDRFFHDEENFSETEVQFYLEELKSSYDAADKYPFDESDSIIVALTIIPVIWKIREMMWRCGISLPIDHHRLMQIFERVIAENKNIDDIEQSKIVIESYLKETIKNIFLEDEAYLMLEIPYVLNNVSTNNDK